MSAMLGGNLLRFATPPKRTRQMPAAEQAKGRLLLAMPLLICMRIVAERIPAWNVLGKMLAAA